MPRYRVKVSSLQTGDVLFLTNVRFPNLGFLIRFGDWLFHGRLGRFSRFSHVAVHLDGGVVLEATKRLGVRMRLITPLDTFDRESVEIRRPLADFYADDSHLAPFGAAAGFVEQFLFRSYDTEGALSSVLPAIAGMNNRFRGRDSYFCSKLVARVFVDIGYPLSERPPETVTPLQLHNSKRLLTLDATDVLEPMSGDFLRQSRGKPRLISDAGRPPALM